ncbi:MAG: hypothetical protein J6S85_04750 [Methanobrevibacter sp.]|nr:hypothetical protein [Methanobrevibacter sp.]
MRNRLRATEIVGKVYPLPHWIVADTLPAFYETEGATAIQMVAKLYNKVKELIESYNELTNDYIQFKNEVNDSLADMNDTINGAVEYMQTHLVETVTALFQQAIDDGTINVGLINNYDETDESLELTVGLIPDGNEVEF